MVLSEVLGKDARIWVKSEWGPASEDWPAVSFSKRSVGDYLRKEFVPGRDAILYIGTSNPATTGNPAHRQRLLSAVNIEPKQLLETRDCIPAKSWEESQNQFRGRWLWSMPALGIWDFDDLPLAHDILPATYRQLGLIVNRGNAVEVVPEEKNVVLGLPVHPVVFQPPHKAGAFSGSRALLDLNIEIRREIGRMVGNILGRVNASGTERTSVNPVRTTSESSLHILLGKKWQEQKGRCFLCQGPLLPGTKNYLLQASPDRTDSLDTAYSDANIRITHLGCNLAKNNVSLTDFEDWLAVVRGELDDVNGEDS
jgi:hypothetical protein